MSNSNAEPMLKKIRKPIGVRGGKDGAPSQMAMAGGEMGEAEGAERRANSDKNLVKASKVHVNVLVTIHIIA